MEKGTGKGAARLRLQEVGGEAVDANALGDGVAGVPQALALGLHSREGDAARNRVKQTRAGRVDQDDLQMRCGLKYELHRLA